MELFSTTLSTIKRHRIQFSISWVIYLVALFILTSLGMLRLVLNQLDSSHQIQLFTRKEIEQLQHYFSFRLLVSAITLFAILLVFFAIRIHRQKKIQTADLFNWTRIYYRFADRSYLFNCIFYHFRTCLRIHFAGYLSSRFESNKGVAKFCLE